jgi:hypothetical protein
VGVRTLVLMVAGFIVVAAGGGGITAERDGVEASGAVTLERVSSATVAASVGARRDCVGDDAAPGRDDVGDGHNDECQHDRAGRLVAGDGAVATRSS